MKKVVDEVFPEDGHQAKPQEFTNGPKDESKPTMGSEPRPKTSMPGIEEAFPLNPADLRKEEEVEADCVAFKAGLEDSFSRFDEFITLGGLKLPEPNTLDFGPHREHPPLIMSWT